MFLEIYIFHFQQQYIIYLFGDFFFSFLLFAVVIVERTGSLREGRLGWRIIQKFIFVVENDNKIQTESMNSRRWWLKGRYNPNRIDRLSLVPMFLFGIGETRLSWLTRRGFFLFFKHIFNNYCVCVCVCVEGFHVVRVLLPIDGFVYCLLRFDVIDLIFC